MASASQKKSAFLSQKLTFLKDQFGQFVNEIIKTGDSWTEGEDNKMGFLELCQMIENATLFLLEKCEELAGKQLPRPSSEQLDLTSQSTTAKTSTSATPHGQPLGQKTSTANTTKKRLATQASTSTTLNRRHSPTKASTPTYNSRQPPPQASTSTYNSRHPQPQASTSTYNSRQPSPQASTSTYNSRHPQPQASTSTYNSRQPPPPQASTSTTSKRRHTEPVQAADLTQLEPVLAGIAQPDKMYSSVFSKSKKQTNEIRGTQSSSDHEKDMHRHKVAMGQVSKEKVKDIKKPRRSKSAYSHFLASRMKEAKKAGLPTKKITELKQDTSDKWWSLPDERKKYFEAVAAADKKRYQDEMAAYNERSVDPSKPKKPPSPFFVFFRDFRVAMANTGRVYRELQIMAGEKWKSMSNEEKKPYEMQAQEESTKYEASIVEYRRTGGGSDDLSAPNGVTRMEDDEEDSEDYYDDDDDV